MKPEGSLPHSQKPANAVHDPSRFCKINFNIILPSTPGSSNWLLSSSFRTKALYASLPHMCYMRCPFQSSWPDLPNDEYTEHKAPCYVVFSIPLLPRPPYTNVQCIKIYDCVGVTLFFTCHIIILGGNFDAGACLAVGPNFIISVFFMCA
jgi:hypothetical protein